MTSPTDQHSETTRRLLDRAARLAIRAHGDAGPNPLVGCVIVKDGTIIGLGHHKRFGGLHAEREALADARGRGHDPAGSAVYCTLEPCGHHGKQPPCTEALIQARVARVVYARPDPASVSGGGAGILRSQGIDTRCDTSSPLATHLSDPFVHRVRTGRPWVIAKWAQTIDGRIATRTGESQWITGPLLRRRVHRLRARVDAVLVGSGTVVADDPSLTARETRRVRRVAKRVVVSTDSSIPEHAKLLADGGAPTLVLSAEATGRVGVNTPVVAVGRGADGRVDLLAGLEYLARERGVAELFIEAGPSVLGSLLEANLIDEAFVHVAPMILADEQAYPSARGRAAESLSDARRFALVRVKSLSGDVELHCRRTVEI